IERSSSPIFQIMFGLESALAVFIYITIQREVRNLVLVIASSCRFGASDLIHLSKQVIIRHRALFPAYLRVQLRSFLHFQQVESHVRGVRLDRLFEIELPILEPLLWEAGDQVETDVRKAGLSQGKNCVSRLIRRVCTTQRNQFSVYERLNPNARSVNSGLE